MLSLEKASATWLKIEWSRHYGLEKQIDNLGQNIYHWFNKEWENESEVTLRLSILSDNSQSLFSMCKLAHSNVVAFSTHSHPAAFARKVHLEKQRMNWNNISNLIIVTPKLLIKIKVDVGKRSTQAEVEFVLNANVKNES